MKKNNVLNQWKNNKALFPFAVGLFIITFATCVGIFKNQNKGTNLSHIGSETPTLQLTITESAEDLTVYPKGEQKNCPRGFYYYENEDFSICYPNTMKVNPSQHIENSNGTQTDMVFFSNATRTLTVLPVFTAAGTGQCFQETPVQVSGLNATRQLNRSTLSEECGLLHQVVTIITRKDSQHFYLYETMKDNLVIDLNEYIQIESSLRVK